MNKDGREEKGGSHAGGFERELDDSHVIITGAGRGLGRATALEVSKRGARVALLSRTREEVEGIARQIRDAGGQALAHAGDVASHHDVEAFVDAATQSFGPPSMLVNNAAIIGPPRFMEDAEPGEWERTLSINLHGAVLMAREVIPPMKSAGDGVIVNITSGLGQMPYPRFAAYAVSKAALIQLTRSLSEELAPHGIRVNGVDPGIMDTSMQNHIRGLGPQRLGEEIHATFSQFHKAGALKDPHDVASLLAWLASPQASHITGEHGTLSHYRTLLPPHRG